MIYCSKSCRAKDTGVGHGVKTGSFVSCKVCSKKVWRKGYLLKKYKDFFCSKICLGKKSAERINNKYKGVTRKWMLGEKNWAWKGGITPINQAIRGSLEYEDWRKTCMERDLYTCQDCGQIGGELNVDHIKSFAEYPELRLDIDNGRTLCIKCHRTTITYGWSGYWKIQRNKFVGSNIG